MDESQEYTDPFSSNESRGILSVNNFNHCELVSQVYHIMDIGKYLGTTVQKEHYVLYYQLNDFYACLFHNLEENRVSHCHAFDDPDELNPLWDQLDISPFILKQ